MPCPLCERMRRGYFLAELRESCVVLSESKAYRGWCTLILKDHIEHLSELPRERQERLFGEVARVAEAIRKVLGPVRLNYECLGNVTAHVHWHVIPRHADDPEPKAAIWVRPEAEREAPLPSAEVQDLAGKLREALS